MPSSLASPHPADAPSAQQQRGKGVAATVYILYLGSIMAVVTAPLGMLIALLYQRRAASLAASHLLFQVRTFWLGALGGAMVLATWQLLGLLGAPAWASWSLGYVFFTACLAWTTGRCGVGIHRLMDDQPIANPRSLLFGGKAVAIARRQ